MGIFRTRPNSSLGDNQSGGGPSRSSWYGDGYSLGLGTPRQNLADEGSYFSGVNAVQATAIVGHVAPAIADNDDTPTKALLHIFNGGQRNIVLDYVKLRWVVVNASSTATGFTAFVDNHGSSSRVSGGTAITPVNTRSDNPTTTSGTVYFGAVVVSAATARKVAQWVVRPVIAVTLDETLFKFGGEPATYSNLTIIGTANANTVVIAPPVVIAPGGNFHLCESNPSGASTGATYEFEFGYWER